MTLIKNFLWGIINFIVFVLIAFGLALGYVSVKTFEFSQYLYINTVYLFERFWALPLLIAGGLMYGSY